MIKIHDANTMISIPFNEGVGNPASTVNPSSITSWNGFSNSSWDNGTLYGRKSLSINLVYPPASAMCWMGTNLTRGSSSISAYGWFRHHGHNTNTMEIVGTVSNTANSFTFTGYSNGSLVSFDTFMWDSSNSMKTVGSGALVLDRWYFVGFCIDAIRKIPIIFVNDLYYFEGPAITGSYNTNATTIKLFSDGTIYNSAYTGQCSHLTLVNRVLTQKEFSALYNSTKGQFL